MARSEFGIRLKQAFAPLNNKEIAAKLGVVPSAVQNYLGGRMPDGSTLLRISQLTGCDIHWLLTGENSHDVNQQPVEPISLDSVFERRMREIVREELRQTPVQDLGSVDEFDLETAVERLNDPQAIMNEWYRADGLAAPADYGVMFFSGWRTFTLKQKIDALRDARRVLDRAK